jgi:hypothetical protein
MVDLAGKAAAVTDPAVEATKKGWAAGRVQPGRGLCVRSGGGGGGGVDAGGRRSLKSWRCWVSTRAVRRWPARWRGAAWAEMPTQLRGVRGNHTVEEVADAGEDGTEGAA